MAAPEDAEAEFGEQMKRDGDLGLFIAEHLWSLLDPLNLAGEEYEIIGGEDVPGYEDDNTAVLLRRCSDGMAFEADIDVTVCPVRYACCEHCDSDESTPCIPPGSHVKPCPDGCRAGARKAEGEAA